MWEIRCQWEHKQDLSRAEWIFLAQYIQVACEEVSGDAGMPTPAAYVVLLARCTTHALASSPMVGSLGR
jgi:hypothetical protein